MKFIQKFTYKIFSVISLCLLCGFDRSDIYIKSNNLIFDSNNNHAIFSNKVVLYFDNYLLTTGIMKIIYNKNLENKKIDQILFYNPLKIVKFSKDTTKNLILTANSGNYNNDNSKLTLVGNVKIQNGSNVVVTQKLILTVKLKNLKK